jgi:glycosyltransferase involved in cell wall biosynthesis
VVSSLAENLRTIWWFHEGQSVRQMMLRDDFRKAIHLASAMVFQTDQQRRVFGSLLYQVPGDRIHTVANGVPQPPEHLVLKVPEPQPFCVVSIGNIYPRKRYDDLIRAVAALSDINMQCWLVGRMWTLSPDAIELANSRPERFKFFGEMPRDTALELLASAHVFSLPSADESMPITNFEAPQLGKALVLSDLDV